MSVTHPHPRLRPWSRLRTRMAVSYVLVTLVLVLLLESLVVALLFYLFTRSPLPGYWALQSAWQSAHVYALQAALLAEADQLAATTTFEPGRADSLDLQAGSAPPEMAWFNLDVPYVGPGAASPRRHPVALLIDPNAAVLASSFPDRYPAGTTAAEAVPDSAALIGAALAGQPDGAVRENADGRYAAVAQTVWSRDHQPLGAVYVETPAGVPPNASLVVDVAAVVIPSGLLWLCLMLPIGLVFGGLTTRGLIRRVEGLARAADRFKQGDLSQRVRVRRTDEVGLLEQQFNEMAEQLVENIQQRAAQAEQSARREERARIEQEMSSAHFIQKALLPETVPALRGWQIETLYRPAREVGGDLYDFLALPDGRLGLVIGDANGKGVPSALIMATACAMLRAAAPGQAAPGQVLALVNNLLQLYIPAATIATCFNGVLAPDSGQLCFANAGHNLPYLLRGGGVLELHARGMPLGLMPQQHYEEHSVTLQPGDCVLLYTDGLVEAHDPQRQMFGGPRLKRLMETNRGPAGLLNQVVTGLQQFTGPHWEQEDDVTLLLLHRAG